MRQSWKKGNAKRKYNENNDNCTQNLWFSIEIKINNPLFAAASELGASLLFFAFALREFVLCSGWTPCGLFYGLVFVSVHETRIRGLNLCWQRTIIRVGHRRIIITSINFIFVLFRLAYLSHCEIGEAIHRSIDRWAWESLVSASVYLWIAWPPACPKCVCVCPCLCHMCAVFIRGIDICIW